MPQPTCRMCGSQPKRVFTAEERHQQMGSSFSYGECGSCGSLWLIDDVADMGAYYSAGYSCHLPFQIASPRARLLAGLARWMPRPLLSWVPPQFSSTFLQVALARHALWLAGQPPRDTRVLDIGCGGALLLWQLHLMGYRHIEGQDLYSPVADGLPFPIHRCDMAALPERYDLVFAMHSFEHMPDPVAAMRTIAGLLSDGGVALLQLPKLPSTPWEMFGDCWLGLDAPRHYVVPRSEALIALAQSFGLECVRQVDEAWPWQYYQSEGFQRGLPVLGTDYTRVLGKPALARYARLAAAEAQAGRSGIGSFVFRRPAG
ncbi:MAG: class I SAM-dependent methyltransferase [Armatimonadetes bacterium]|nr:class I SAM-dependent methyltransferase [Armatimonadota bacterium]